MNSTEKPSSKKKASNDKNIALWRVVFFGPGEWFFNIKKNKKKLLIGLPITVISLVAVIFFMLSAYITLAYILEEPFRSGDKIDQHRSQILYGIISLTGAIAVHIWALIDVFSRSESWYENYPD